MTIARGSDRSAKPPQKQGWTPTCTKRPPGRSTREISSSTGRYAGRSVCTITAIAASSDPSGTGSRVASARATGSLAERVAQHAGRQVDPDRRPAERPDPGGVDPGPAADLQAPAAPRDRAARSGSGRSRGGRRTRPGSAGRAGRPGTPSRTSRRSRRTAQSSASPPPAPTVPTPAAWRRQRRGDGRGRRAPRSVDDAGSGMISLASWTTPTGRIRVRAAGAAPISARWARHARP